MVNVINANELGLGIGTTTGWATSDQDIYVFAPGHGNDSVVNFDFRQDQIDLTRFGDITWDELQDHISIETDGIYSGPILTINLEKWGGGIIQFRAVGEYSPNPLGVQTNLLNRDCFRLAGEDAPTVLGTGGDDAVGGTGGDDIIDGGAGDDQLTAFRGDDYLDGGAGDDFISGGGGDARIIGGAGNDTFYFSKNDGNDTIEDFSDGDRIDLRSFRGIASFDGVNATQDGENVVLDFSAQGGGTITLENFDLDDLTAEDFIFTSYPDSDAM